MKIALNKYFVLFLILGALFFYLGILIDFSIFSIILFWLALDLLLISFSYCFNSTFMFGKQSNGKINIVNKVLLFPYLLFIWKIWRFATILDKPKPFNQLTENIWIGRRLLNSEGIQNIDLVLDLTSEFSEPMNLIAVKEYLSFPILDAGVPIENEFKRLLNYLKDFNGNIYIHCAQGSGRTGIVACGYLLFTGKARTLEEAYQFVKSKRPSVKLNSEQFQFLKQLFNKAKDIKQ